MSNLTKDWTKDSQNRSNSSPIFQSIVNEIAKLIRNDLRYFSEQHINATAHLILAQLAHVHGLVPSVSSRVVLTDYGKFVRGHSGIFHYHCELEHVIASRAAKDALENLPSNCVGWFWFNKISAPMCPDDTPETLEDRWLRSVLNTTFAGFED